MRQLGAILCGCALATAGLSGTARNAVAADPQLPEAFDLSGRWVLPGPATSSHDREGPGWYRTFWNYQVMAGRDWLELYPDDPFQEITTDPPGYAFRYVGIYHHVMGYYSDYVTPPPREREGYLCARQPVDYRGNGRLEFHTDTKHYEFAFRGTPVGSSYPWELPGEILLDSGEPGGMSDCAVPYLYADDEGAELRLGLNARGELITGTAGRRPDCGTAYQEPWEEFIAGGGYTMCFEQHFRRSPGLPADFRGTIAGRLRTATGSLEVNEASVTLFQQHGAIAPVPPGTDVATYLNDHKTGWSRTTAVDATGRFEFEDVPLFATYTFPSGGRTALIGASYALLVSDPATAGLDPTVHPGGRAYYRGLHLVNVELPDSPLDIVVEPFPGLARKERLIAALCELSPTNYCEWEEGYPGHASARQFIDRLTATGYEPTAGELEALHRGTTAEDVVRVGADSSRDLVGKGLEGLGLLLSNAIDELDLAGTDVKNAKEWHESGASALDPELLRTRYGIGATDETPWEFLAAQRLDAIYEQSVVFETLDTLVSMFRTGILDRALEAVPDLSETRQEVIGSTFETVGRTIALHLAGTALDSVGKGGLKPALVLAVKQVPALFSDLLFDSAVAPSYCEGTTPSLQYAVESMTGWTGFDAVAANRAANAVYVISADLIARATEITEGWLMATEFWDASADWADDVLGFVEGHPVARGFRWLAKGIKFGADVYAVAWPMAFTLAYAPAQVERGVYRAFDATPPAPPGKRVAPPPPAPAPGRPQPLLLTAAELDLAFAGAATILDTLRGHLEADRIGDAIRLVAGADWSATLDECSALAADATRLLAAAARVRSAPLPEGGVPELQRLAQVRVRLVRERSFFEDLFVDFFGRLLVGEFGDGLPAYHAARAHLLRAHGELVAAHADARTELAALLPELSSRHASAPSVLAVDLLELSSDVTGARQASASPETFTLRARVRNLGAAGVADVAVALSPLPAEAATVLSAAVLTPGGGMLAADDGEDGSGADEAELQWTLRYQGDLAAGQAVLLRATVTEGTGAPASFLAFDLGTTLRVAQELFDADLDGLPDGYESAHGLDPTADDAREDADGDGLLNRAEYRLGTDPHLADSDGDGRSDGAELHGGTAGLGTDPLAADTDGDGTGDGEDGSPFDPTTTGTMARPAEPVVAVSPTEVVLTAGEPLAAIRVTNAGDGFLRWSTRTDDEAVVAVGGPDGIEVTTGGILLLQVPAGLDLILADGLETTVWVYDVEGLTPDAQPITVRLEGSPTAADADADVDGESDALADGGPDADADADAPVEGGADGGGGGDGGGGCGCRTAPRGTGAAWVVPGLLLAFALRRRDRRRRS
jgi:MYXO-CTERM domain-containing protein